MFELVVQLMHSIQAEPVLSALVLVLLAFTSGMLMMPLFVFELCSGALFGTWHAFLLMSCAIWLIVPSSLFLGRNLLHSRIQQMLETRPKVEHMLHALEQKGFLLMVLVRLSPLTPFGLTNYALSLSRMKWWKVTFATWLGASPLLIAMIVLGAQSSELGNLSQNQNHPWVLPLGIAVLGLVIFLVQKTLRNALSEFKD